MPHASGYSRFVAWAKIVLPLGALALLSTIFLISERIDPSAAIPYAEVDVEKLARESALIGPEYAGVTDGGAALTVTAREARPGVAGQTGALAEGLAAKLSAPDGFVADMTAKQGLFRPDSGQIVLDAGVSLQTSTGYRIASERIELATDRSRLLSPGPVKAEAPFGTLSAGRMELHQPAPGAPHDLVFNDGVKLVYRPKE